MYHLKPGHTTTSKLMSICWQLFQAYGTPDEFSTNGGPPFTSCIFQKFLQTWYVKHILSPVAYFQSSWAELVIKTTKRIMNGNTGPQGFLGNDNVAWSIRQYQTTPIQGNGLILAQLLLHHQLCDSISSQPILYKPHSECTVVKLCREEIFHPCNAKILERCCRYTDNLSTLWADDTVAIQSPLIYRWNTTRKIITVLLDHQYQIRIDGSRRNTLRRCCFLRKCKIKAAPTPIPSATPVSITSTINAPLLHPKPSTSSSNDRCAAIERPQTSHIYITMPSVIKNSSSSVQVITV